MQCCASLLNEIHLVVYLEVHVSSVVLLLHLTIDLQLKLHVMRIFYLLFLQQIAKDKESILHLANEVRSFGLDCIDNSHLVCHIEQ